MLEKHIENQIIGFLRANGVLCFKVKSTATYDRKGGFYRSISKNYMLGVADIIGIFKGTPLAIEVKTKTGRLSQNQITFLKTWKEQGGIAIIARSLDDVSTFLFNCAADSHNCVSSSQTEPEDKLSG